MNAAFHFHPLTNDGAAAVASWRYAAPYSFYDPGADTEDLALLLDPQNWEDMYFAVENEHGEFVGFFQFRRDNDTVEIGLGLRPDLTGQGIGLSFVQAGLEFAGTRYAPTEFRLAVAAFNERAITVYERAGFTRTRTFKQHTNGGTYEFVEMARSATDGAD